MKHYIAIFILFSALPVSALTLNGSVDYSVDIEQPKMEFEAPAQPVRETTADAVDFSGSEQYINLHDAKKRVDNDILERRPNTTGYYYNNGQVEYIGVKVKKEDI